jgi:hypothetical protein
MRHEIVDVMFLILGAAITAGAILFDRWLHKEVPKLKEDV